MSTATYSHVVETLRRLCDEPNDIRCRAIYSERFISHRYVQEAMNQVAYQVSLPPQTRAWGLVVYGQPGSGKSQLALAVKKRLCALQAEKGSEARTPVVLISMTGAREAHTIFGRILDALEAPISPTMRRADKENFAIDLMNRAHTQLLAVDEIQDVLSSTVRQQRAALDVIKLIMNSLGIPVLALGTAKAAEAMQEDPHLAARFDHLALPLWKDNDDTRALLAAIQRTLPLKRESDLTAPAMVKLIVDRSKGCLARIVRLVNTAAVFAIESGVERIERATLELASTSVPNANIFRRLEEGVE